MKKGEFRDYTGQQFGMWFVACFHGVQYGKVNLWVCRCECGREAVHPIGRIKHKPMVSCGCKYINPAKTHGMSGTSTYRSWCGMKERCEKPNCQQYSAYGGRGIRICSGLSDSFETFLNLVGEKPIGTSIDRIENNEHYSCGQCRECAENRWPFNLRWATPKQQARNRRNNSFVMVRGERLTQSEVAEKYGFTDAAINARVSRGVIGDALIAPLNPIIKRRVAA